MTSRKHHVHPRKHGNHGARIRRRAYPQDGALEGAKYGVRGTIQHKTEEQTKGKK